MMSLTCSMLNVPFVVVSGVDVGVVRTRTTSKDETGLGNVTPALRKSGGHV